MHTIYVSEEGSAALLRLGPPLPLCSYCTSFRSPAISHPPFKFHAFPFASLMGMRVRDSLFAKVAASSILLFVAGSFFDLGSRPNP